MQIPPQFSALKRGGKRVSDLARQGVDVKLEPRKVIVEALTLPSFSPPMFTLGMTTPHSLSCSVLFLLLA